jgi:hypothetical protein
MTIKEENDDEWGGLSVIDRAEVNPNEVVPEDKLPFELLKLKVDEPEEEIESIRTSEKFNIYYSASLTRTKLRHGLSTFPIQDKRQRY